MSVSVRTRFEVFKRDRFTCSYCGRTPPEVLLEADHIIPKAAGGGDEIANLTTACATCNGGKAARLLEEGTAPVVGRATIAELAERVEQGKAYMEALGGLAALVDRQYQLVIDTWAKAFGAVLEERETGSFWVFKDMGGSDLFPNEHSVARFLRKMSFEAVLDAVSITAARMRWPGRGTTLYFYGVCNHSIREGRDPGAPRTVAPALEEDDHEIDYQAGLNRGQYDRDQDLRAFFRDHVELGFPTLEDAVRHLWPEE